MAELIDPVLSIETIEGDPRHRRATVRFSLGLASDDELVGQEIEEFVRLHAVDEHDAVARPNMRPIAEHRTTSTARPGRHVRIVEFVLARSDLDVQEDWWSSGPGGETRPIAEWPDHVAADVALSRSGEVVTSATTPTVTGSWGVLADDVTPDAPHG